jgi:hypothetical protein
VAAFVDRRLHISMLGPEGAAVLHLASLRESRIPRRASSPFIRPLGAFQLEHLAPETHMRLKPFAGNVLIQE